MKSNPIRYDETQIAEFLRHALSKNLGVIPDPDEPYFSRKAIASFMGYSDKTFSNNKYDFPDIAHPLGNFYRLSQFIPKMVESKALRSEVMT